ncbi:MAG: flagellar biosynthesis regulator FlaF [Alphaproteobacteria bacterium]|nr:flagellar biosynthesis regulator FlaF [Alphaproteobacteria bacterium]
MNAAELARSAYASTKSTILTDRGTEYAVFSRITQNIKAASIRGSTGFPALVAALHENRKLWSILANDVADEENGLPEQLRARIFYLAEFTDFQTQKILAGEAAADALVDINTSVMRGLRNISEAVS